MAPRTATASLKPSAIVAEVVAEKERLAQRAEALIQQIDQSLAEKNQAYDALLKSVNLADATALVMKDIDHSLRGLRQRAEATVKTACLLHRHVPVEYCDSLDALGHRCYSTRMPQALRLLEGLDALSLVAMLPDLFKPALETFIRKTLAEGGQPETGDTVTELEAKAGELLAEIKALNAERESAVESLNFVLASHIKLPKEFVELLNPQPAGVAVPESTAAVKTFDDNGNHVKMVFG